MAKIKHIAIATQNEEETAKFYTDVFGLSQVGKINIPSVSGYFLTDGDINVAILHFKNDQVAGVERGKEWTGIHHIGFQVDSLDDVAARLTAAGSSRRHDVERALGVSSETEGNVEVKWTGPDGVMLDVSKTGWLGTQTFGR